MTKDQKQKKYKARFLLLGFKPEKTSRFQLGENILIRKGLKRELKEIHDRIDVHGIDKHEYLLEFNYKAVPRRLGDISITDRAYEIFEKVNFFFHVFFDEECENAKQSILNTKKLHKWNDQIKPEISKFYYTHLVS